MKPTPITWASVSVKLGTLVPWSENPRLSTEKQARRILESFKTFGQVQTIAIGPKFEVLDGHQRLSALLTLHGPEFEIDARQASRELTLEERQRLVILIHSGAVGQYDWHLLCNFPEDILIENGLDQDLIASLNEDAGAIAELLGVNAEPESQGGNEVGETNCKCPKCGFEWNQ